MSGNVVESWTNCTMSKLDDGRTITTCTGPGPAWWGWVSLAFHIVQYAVLVWLFVFWLTHRRCQR